MTWHVLVYCVIVLCVCGGGFMDMLEQTNDQHLHAASCVNLALEQLNCNKALLGW